VDAARQILLPGQIPAALLLHPRSLTSRSWSGSSSFFLCRA
jgi:hypothetical protein